MISPIKTINVQTLKLNKALAVLDSKFESIGDKIIALTDKTGANKTSLENLNKIFAALKDLAATKKKHNIGY